MQFVIYNRQNSEMQPVTCGLPQRSILGPLVLTPLLNDIDTNLQLCDMILYLNDIVMFHAGRTKRDIENSLSCELEQIASWFNENNLVVDLKKSKAEAFFMRHIKSIKCKCICSQVTRKENHSVNIL